jgi:pimeloyl-ACP methyl ester carboxylesterase
MFAEQWSANAPLRGIVVRLPGDDLVAAAARGRLDFVAIDLVNGPTDEIAMGRLAGSAKAAGLGVVAVATSSPERLTQLGADVVIPPGDASLRVTDEIDGSSTGDQPLALDVAAVVARLLDGFAGAAVAPPAPLVLLPGMLGSARVFADVVADLPDTISCRPLRIDLDETVTDTAESVLAAAPPRFALAGHSLGGIVALEVWRRAPQRVTRLALLNSSARPPSDDQLHAWGELRARTERGAFAEVVAEQAAINVGEPGAQRPELVSRWIELAGDVGPEGFLRQLSVQASRLDARPHLIDISVPTLVLSGSDDTVCPAEIQAELAAAIPGAVHVTIDGAGHMSPLDHPCAVAAALGDWLAAG